MQSDVPPVFGCAIKDVRRLIQAPFSPEALIVPWNMNEKHSQSEHANFVCSKMVQNFEVLQR